MPAPVTVTIITLNAESKLEPCLASVAFADEILIVDSGSTDSTIDIASRHGARVITQAWLGYGAQKRFAALQAKHDWILSLDADERVSHELGESIRRALEAPHPAAYEFARRNRFMGRWLGHGEGYPDWSTRLFDRTRATWSDDTVHEKVVVRGPVTRLHGDLLHESESGLANYLAKQNQYTTLAARQLHAAGKPFSALTMLFGPLVRFVKFYFLRLGILDGLPGLVHISIGCFNTFAKQAKLAELKRGRR
jgi:glycosyltransferase involved in cell wall biosynthesis